MIEDIQVYSPVKVEIYNRWGNLVFASEDYDNKWEGKHNGKELPGGVYFYVVDFGTGDPAITGNITLIR